MERTLKISVEGPKGGEAYSINGDIKKKDIPGIIDLLRTIAKAKQTTMKELCSPTVFVGKLG